MDVIALLCVLFILLNIQYPKKDRRFFGDALAKEQTDALKGFAALLIVLGHLGQTVHGGVSFPVLRQIGLFTVTVFFALSGYGLVLSYKRKGCRFEGFWKKRLLTVILPYAVFTVLYIFVRAYLGEDMSAKTILLSFVNGTPLVRYSWFVEVIIAIYAAFWVSGKIAKDDVSLLCFMMTVFIAVFCIGMKKLGFEACWYNTAMSFIVGMLWAHKSEEITRELERHLPVYLIGTFIVLALLIYCVRVLWMWEDLGEELVTTVFVAFVLMLQYLVPAKSNAVTRFLGDISFELYMSHGAFIMLLWQMAFFKENPPVFCLAVYFGAGVTAWLMHILIGKIKKF